MAHPCPIPVSNRLTRGLKWVIGGYWLAMFVATHIPSKVVPDLHVTDKVEHFAAYGLLAMLMGGYAWARRWCLWRSAIWPIVIGAIYGAVDELTQPYFNRACDIRDWRADVIGAVLGTAIILLARWICWRRKAKAGARANANASA